VAQFADGFGFYLANALPCYAEHFADFFKRARKAHADAVS
jgi:hypothetical protein